MTRPDGDAFAAAVQGRRLGTWIAKGRNSKETEGLSPAPDAEGRLDIVLPQHRLRLFHDVPRAVGAQQIQITWELQGPRIVAASLQHRGGPEHPWRTLCAFPVAEGQGRLTLPRRLPEGHLALVLEAPPGSRLLLGPVRSQPAQDPGTLPAYATGSQNAWNVAALNENFPGAAAADRVATMRAELDNCRRLGLFDRAAALHDAMLEAEPEVQWSDRDFRNLCRSWVATGRTHMLRSALSSRPDLVARDDELFAMAARLRVEEGAKPEPYARLPSGAPNLALVSAVPRLASALIPADLLAGPPSDGPDADTALLAANYWCGRDRTLWLRWLGNWCDARGLGRPVLGEGPSPVPLRLRFPEEERAHVADHPSISVIMAAYNAQTTVTEAVESMLRQTLRNVDLLVCDDGSTDGTLEHLRRYSGHPRVRVFRSLANQGTYNIRNALLPRAQGALVSFQDCDDCSHPRRLEQQWRSLAPGVAAVVAHHVRFGADGRMTVFANQKPERMAPVTCLASREAYIASGMFRRVSVGADSESLERLRETFGPDAVTEERRPLLFALWSASSLTRQSDLAQTEDGYIAPSRRALREAAVLRQLLGPTVMDDDAVDDVARRQGLFRTPAGVEELR